MKRKCEICDTIHNNKRELIECLVDHCESAEQELDHAKQCLDDLGVLNPYN